jgi:hypothetical protein
MAQEKTILLAVTCGEADEAAQRVSVLEDELVPVRQVREVAEGKILSLVAKL